MKFTKTKLLNNEPSRGTQTPKCVQLKYIAKIADVRQGICLRHLFFTKKTFPNTEQYGGNFQKVLNLDGKNKSFGR